MSEDRVPTLWQFFFVFARIGLTSFGGGLSGWLWREFVREKRWLSEEEFLDGLGVAQALPGINVTNMAIWIGYRLLGPWGAAVGFLGIVVPPAFVIVGLGAGFSALAGFETTHLALAGAAAAAVGLSMQMGFSTAWRVPRRVVPLGLLAVTFVTVALLHWPLPWVVLGVGGVGVAAEYLRLVRA